MDSIPFSLSSLGLDIYWNNVDYTWYSMLNERNERTYWTKRTYSGNASPTNYQFPIFDTTNDIKKKELSQAPLKESPNPQHPDHPQTYSNRFFQFQRPTKSKNP